MSIMSILARSFSRFIDTLLYPPKDPLDVQRKLLSNIIKVNKNTLFGKKHNFSQIRTIRDFQKACPVCDYSKFEPYIQKMVNGEKNILVGSKHIYWGKTAGTSGKYKLIPITRKSIINASKCSFRIILSYICENPKLNSKILNGTMYFYASDPLVDEINGIPAGYGTGAFAQSSSNLFMKFYNFNIYTPLKFYKIKDYSRRINAMIKEACKLNITTFFGVTSILINFMEQIIHYLQKNGQSGIKIKDVFPNYSFSIMGGEPFKFYENRFYHVVGKKIDCREIYGATEETIAVQLHSVPGLSPMLDTNFLEFVPVNDDSERLLIDEVEKHKEYFVVMTNYNGLYAYNIFDIIEFISIDPPLLIFKRRKDTINLASEKITLDQLYMSIKLADIKLNCKAKDYLICGTLDPKPRYILVIEFLPNSRPLDYKEYLIEFNKNLMNLNTIYDDLINVQKAILPPIIWVVKTDSFNKYQTEQLRKGCPAGQAKFPKISIKKEILEYFSNKILKIEEI